MLSLSLINPFDDTVNIRTLAECGWTGVQKAEISNRVLNAPMKLEIELNTDFPYFEEIMQMMRASVGFGFRITTHNVDLAFISIGGDGYVTSEGTISLTLMQSSEYLKYIAPVQQYRNYTSISLATYLANFVSNRFVFVPISVDRNITIKGDLRKPYELVNDAINQLKNPDYSWREGSIVEVSGVWKTQIFYGDFGNDATAYYELTGDKSFMPLYLRNTTTVDSSDDLDIVQLNSIKEHFNYGVPNRFKVMVDTGSGVNLNSAYNLTPSLVSNINSQFPFVSEVVDGQTVWFILNTLVRGEPTLYDTMTLSTSSSSENQYSSNFDTLESAQLAYYDAVRQIKEKSYNSYFSPKEDQLKKLVLAGIETIVDYKKIKKLADGRTVTLFDIQDSFVNKELDSVNLLEITN